VATFIVAHPTSYASSALQADFAANCKIWVEQGAPSEVFAAPETETLKEYLQIGH
jgi:hypothetical protein